MGLRYWWLGGLLTNSKNYFILFLTQKTYSWAASDTGSTFICLVFWAFYLLVFLCPYPNDSCQKDKVPQPSRTHVGFIPQGATNCWETGPWPKIVNLGGPRFLVQISLLSSYPEQCFNLAGILGQRTISHMFVNISLYQNDLFLLR